MNNMEKITWSYIAVIFAISIVITLLLSGCGPAFWYGFKGIPIL